MPWCFEPSLQVPQNHCSYIFVISGVQHTEVLSSELSNKKLHENPDTAFITRGFYDFCLFLGVLVVYLVTVIKGNHSLFPPTIKGCFCLSNLKLM